MSIPAGQACGVAGYSISPCKLAMEARPSDTFTVGSTVPQYTGLLLPGPLLSHDIYPSEYFLVQAITPQFDVVLGKISDIYIPDQTLFGDSYKYYFANFNFNKNPMTDQFL